MITKKLFNAVQGNVRRATYEALVEQMPADDWTEMLDAVKSTNGIAKYYQLADQAGHGTKVMIERFDRRSQIHENALRERGFDPDHTSVRLIMMIDTVKREADIYGEWRS